MQGTFKDPPLKERKTKFMRNPRPLKVITDKSSVRDLALTTKEILSHGWMQGEMYNNDASGVYDDSVINLCLMGGACRACIEDEGNEVRFKMYDQIRAATGFASIASFNDDKMTTKEIVLDLLQEIADDPESSI